MRRLILPLLIFLYLSTLSICSLKALAGIIPYEQNVESAITIGPLQDSAGAVVSDYILSEGIALIYRRIGSGVTVIDISDNTVYSLGNGRYRVILTDTDLASKSIIDIDIQSNATILPYFTRAEVLSTNVYSSLSGGNTAQLTVSVDTCVVSGAVTLVDGSITSVSYDQFSAFPVKSVDSGATQIARVGAGGDTLETLSDQIDGTSTFDNTTDNVTVGTNTDKTGYGLTSSTINTIVTSTTASTWNELLTGATYNDPTSAGRRLRQVDVVFLESGTAQAGAAGSITLENTESASNDFYLHSNVTITAGTGINQIRIIENYTGATRVADVTPDWIVAPDNTSEYQISGNGTVHAHEVDKLSAAAETSLINSNWKEILTGYLANNTAGKILRQLGEGHMLLEGTAQSGTSTTVVLENTAVGTDNYYQYGIIAIVGGTGDGQARLIHSYIGSTFTATIEPGWIVSPDNTSDYIIHDYGYVHAHIVEELGAQAKADVNAEADTAFSDYDPPTNTEMLSAHSTSDSLISSAKDEVIGSGDSRWLTNPLTESQIWSHYIWDNLLYTQAGGSLNLKK